MKQFRLWRKRKSAPSHRRASSTCLVLVLGLASCGSGEEDPDASPGAADSDGSESPSGDESDPEPAVGEECDEDRVLVFGLVEPMTAPSGILAESFAGALPDATDGRLSVDIVPASQLGAPLEQIEALRSGSQALLAFDKGFNAEYVEDYAALEVPFVVDSGEALLNVLDSELGERLRGELEEAGVVTLSDRYLVAPRVVFTTEPASSVDDFQGMRFRVPEIDVYFDTWSAIGISPTPIPWGEIYLSLQQGVIQGGEGPLVAVESNSFTEVAQNVLATNHLHSVNNILMSGPVFDELCASDQATLRQVAADIEKANNDRLADDLAESERVIREEHGATITEPSADALEEFRQRSLDAGQDLEAQGTWSEGLLEEIRSLQ